MRKRWLTTFKKIARIVTRGSVVALCSWGRWRKCWRWQKMWTENYLSRSIREIASSVNAKRSMKSACPATAKSFNSWSVSSIKYDPSVIFLHMRCHSSRIIHKDDWLIVLLRLAYCLQLGLIKLKLFKLSLLWFEWVGKTTTWRGRKCRGTQSRSLSGKASSPSSTAPRTSRVWPLRSRRSRYVCHHQDLRYGRSEAAR